MPKTKLQNEQLKADTKKKILDMSILYFSKNGFAGTRISDLANYIGIAPGTIYNYFDSKEALFEEINKFIAKYDLSAMRNMVSLPIKAYDKVILLSEYIIHNINTNFDYAAILTLNTQQMYESGNNFATKSTYCSEAFQLLMQIVKVGQKEGTFVKGSVEKLVDFYWGVAYLYALKKLFTKDYQSIDANDLSRILLKKIKS